MSSNKERQLFLEHIGKKEIPKGFWKKDNKIILENVNIWIKWFEIYKNITSLEDWYSITGAMINKSGSGFFTSKAENSFNESLITLLKTIYPKYEWKEYKFSKTSQGWWSKIENRLLWLEDFRKLKKLDELDDFYNIKVDDLQDQKGSGWAKYYDHSLIYMLKDLYPDHIWYEWRFTGQVPKNFWNNVDNIDRWFTIEIIGNGFSDYEDMYKLTQPIIHKLYGNGLLTHHFQGSTIRLLNYILPEYNWQFWKFVSAPNNAWDSIENQQKYVREEILNNNKSPECLYYEYTKFPTGFVMKYQSIYELLSTCIPNFDWEEKKLSAHITEFKLFTFLRKFYTTDRENTKICPTKRFDFCIEELRCIFELDGPHHFVDVSYHKSIAKERQEIDVFKMKTAKRNGYRVIRLLQKDVYKNDEKWLDEHLKPHLTLEGDPVVYICPNDFDIYNNHKELMK